jgi:predicted O-linked N-acetylglucosamine transferase (SPINDLY family)
LVLCPPIPAPPIPDGILAADPKAAIVLLAGHDGAAVPLLQARFAETISADRDRIIFLPWQNFDDYCRLLQLAGVILDPPHFGAGSTCYDIFSYNQLTVTMPDELCTGRIAAAFYKKMQIDELIASSPAEYVAVAVRLGCDRDYRMTMREKVRAASPAVFDDLEAVREHERFFTEALARPRGGSAAVAAS